MRNLLLVAVAALPLAACGSGGTTVTATNASAGEVAAKMEAAGGGLDQVKPGRWEAKMTMHAMKIAGLTPAQQAQMDAKMGEAQAIVSCITSEQVKAKRAFFTGADPEAEKSCKYDHFIMSGGKIDAEMSCDHDGQKTNAKMTGTFSPETYHMDMATSDPGATGLGAQSMTITVDAKYAGVCRGDENK